MSPGPHNPFALLAPQSSVFALAFACPLAFSWLLTACLIRWAPRLGLVDYPSARKFHTHPTPRGGGLAIFLAFAATALLFWAVLIPPSASGWQLLLSPLIVALGLLDDLRPLPWQLRLAVQAAVAVAAVLLCLPPLAWPLRALAVVWVVGMVNAFNMLDNMDALSAGVAWVAAGFLVLAVVLQRAGGMDTPAESVLPLLMLMGALSGFLWFNAPPARIFMGDAGSTFLGFFLALSALEAALRPGGPPWAGAVPLCVCAVPCYDLVSVVSIRLRQGRSPFEADKQHLSHRLVGRGFSPPGAVRLIYLLGAAGGVSGLLLYAVGTWAGAALVLVQLAAWWAALAVIEYVTRERPAPERPRGEKTERMRTDRL